MDREWRFEEGSEGPRLVTRIDGGSAWVRLLGSPGSFRFLAAGLNAELAEADWNALMPSFHAALNSLNARTQQA